MTRIRAAVLSAVLAVSACSGGDAKPSGPATAADSGCIDRDGDGYGQGCSRGADCDDRNANETVECLRCAEPNDGCPCELGTQPTTCYLDKTEAEDGTIMCNEGTRYCRDSRWSECENVHTFPLPPERAEATALIANDGGPVQCNDCSVNCFRISDNLDPIDGGLNGDNSNQTSFVPGGGLTLSEIPQDAGMPPPPYDPSTCMPGTAPDIDCDGIPDQYDPFPEEPPFATANPGIFLDIGPGETGTGDIDLDFYINSADVYFLVDQSASMADERDRLKADLISGDFINDPNYNCADVNLNHVADDNALKSQGIVGAINCIIRDASFGTGFHREIPFTNYADNQQIAFDNYQDVTSNRMDVLAAINRLNTIGNIDWPEASMIALNSIVTGNGQYFGTTKRGIPPRIDCPAGTWGYPCFRDNAIPIVILFTDAMMHNGPDNNNYAYNASNLGITRGTDARYFPVAVTNEDFATSYNAGDLTSTVSTFTGDSANMTSAIDKTVLSCLTEKDGPDAFFRFDLTQTRTVRISSEGSRFDTVLGLFAGKPTAPTVLPASSNTNETAATATSLGTITGGSVKISGSTAAMAANYDWSAVQCSADPAARDAVYRFDVTAPTNVEISTVGSTFDTVLGLHNALPALAPTYTASSNTNEALESAENMGAAYNGVLARSGSTSGRAANYLGAEIGCGADNTAPDVVHKFTLTQPTRVRVSTEGSSFDNVIALVGDTCGGSSVMPPTNTEPSGSNAVSGAQHTFLVGSLIIPMGTTYQDSGMLKAYGLVYTLLRNDIPVSWVIKKSKLSGEADFTASSTHYVTSAAITNHGYRGGPFVIDSTDATRAAPYISAYLTANPSVAVHRATTTFDGYVRRQLTGAPRFALMRDGGEAVARAYLAAANITDSAGTAWPDTASDVKTLTQLAGAANGVVDGALFDGAGTPAFCGVLSTGWTPAAAATAQGVEVVAETRAFLEHNTSLFAQDGSTLAFENGAGGRFITLDGYLVGTAPSGLSEANLDSPFGQIDGPLTASGGSYGALALPELDDYKDNDATIFGLSAGSAGQADLLVTARLDGECSILDDLCDVDQARGFVTYLAGSAYTTATPITSNSGTNGARLFLNAMFATGCATKEQRPAPTVLVTGSTATTNATNTFTVSYINDADGIAHNGVLEYALPAGATFVSATGGGTHSSGIVRWTLGSLGADEAGSYTVTVTFPAFGTYSSQATVRFTQGNTARSVQSWVVSTTYSSSADLQCTALGVSQVNVPSTNETQGTAHDMATLNGRIYRLSGSTGGMAPDYTSSETGICNANSASPDAAYHFHLNQPANVTISTEGTSWDTVLSLYNGSVSPTDTVTTVNTNETTSTPVALGNANGRRVTVSGGNSNAMVSNYTTAEIGCTADASSPDAVYSFTLTSPTTVRMSTAGSSFDTVMSLHNGVIVPPPSTATTATSGHNMEWLHNAYVVPLSASGRDQTFTGSTGPMDGEFHLPSTCYTGSSPSTASPDAVFSFSVTTSGTYEIDTTGSDFDTIVAVYDSTPQFVDTNSYNIQGEDGTFSGRFPVGSVTRSQIRLDGDTDVNGSTWTGTGCDTSSSAEDSFVAFSVTGTTDRTVTIDTNGSDFDTTLQLYRFTNTAQTTYTAVACDDDAGDDDASRISTLLVPGNYFVVISGDASDDDGDFNLRIRDSSPATDVIACNDDPASGVLRARIASVALTAGNTYYAIIKGYASNSKGGYALQIRDNALTASGSNNRIDCNDDNGTSQQSQIQTSLGIGTYYVVVKGGASTAKGSYSLVVEDVTSPPVGSVLECDDNDGPSGSSRIQRSLAAGDYWVVLKGKLNTSSGAYSLRVADDSAAVATVLDCNDDGGIDNNALIERDLTPGTYYVVIKGDAPADAGNYKLSVRDVTNRPLNLLTCDDDGSAAGASRINRDLTPGTYYLTVKGDAATNAGAYTLTVQDTANSPVGAIACDDDSGTYKTSVISRSLNAGTYYVGLKGYNANAKGDYQLTIGGGTTSSSFYVPPTWSQTLSALNARGAKVIPILSCKDDPDHGNVQGDCNRVRAQAITLANSTDTLGANLQPLYFDISRNGTGLSKNVVDGIAALAEYLEMDVRVIVKFDPDANPGFQVAITAIDEIGDGCTGVIGSEHQNCAPGATPRFSIAITNPLPGVPPHPLDPNGGYTFRAQLIGDDQFVVEEVPIYIIPESLDDMGPDEPPVYAEGTYWQDTSSPGCVNENQTPDWGDLSWDADVYRNTTIEFIACTSATVESLDTCTPVEVAEITGGADCTADSDCTAGYCDPNIGVCQVTLGGACTSDTQCAENAFCDADLDRCMYESQPVYVGQQLRNANFERHIRMRINMRVTEPFEDPPVLHRWEMTYYCTNNL